MAKKRINVYWLLLLVLMYTASILLAVGRTQARFNDSVSVTTLVGSQQVEVTSNCLVTAQDARVTVLGGRMSLITSKKLSFWLKSSGADAVGILRWGVQDPDHAQYLKITMQSGADVISPEAEIDLLEDVPMELTMTLTPTETARNTVHEELKIYVLVTWGERMWGTFQVILPEVKEETEPEETEPVETEPEVTEPEETKPEETEPEVTEPEETEPEETEPEETEPEETEPEETEPEVTEPEETEPEETEPEETEPEVTEPEVTEPEVTEPEGTEPEVTEPKVTEPEVTEPEVTEPEVTEPEVTEPEVTEPEETEPEVTEPGETEPEETEPKEEGEEKDPIRLETLSRFDASGMLPVNVVLTEEVTSVRIGLGEINSETEEDPERPMAEVLPLPNKTRFSLDGGENFYMLYEGSVAEFSVEGMTSFTILLDLRYTGMEVGTGFLLAMDAYAGEEPVANSFERTICGSTKSITASVYDKEAYQKRQMRTAAEEEEPLKKKGSYVLNQNTVLELTMPEEWQEAEMVYRLEFLTMAEDKTLEYKPVNLKTSGLYAVYDAEKEDAEDPQTETDAETEEDGEERREHTLVLGIGDTLPQAGTYRIHMEWTYKGVCYAKKQFTFFINYAASQVFAE